MTALDLKTESIKSNPLGRLIDFIQSNHDIIETLDEINKYLYQIVKCDYIIILFNYEKQRYFTIHHALNQLSKKLEYDVIIPYSETSITEIIRSHHPLIRDDLSERGKLTPGDSKFLADGIRSDLSIPIMNKNRVQAVINLSSYEANYFNSDHIVQAEQVASLLAIALEKLELEEKLKTRKSDLAAWKTKFNCLIDHVNDAIAIVRPDCDLIDDTNKAFQKLTGYSFEELQNMRLSQLHPKQVELILSRLDKCANNGRYGEIDKIQITCKGGKQILVKIRFVLFGEGHVNNFAFAFYEIIAQPNPKFKNVDKITPLTQEFVQLQLSVFNQISRLANDNLEVDCFVQATLIAIKKIVDFDYAQITLTDPASDKIECFTIATDRCQVGDGQNEWKLLDQANQCWYHYSEENLQQKIKEKSNGYQQIERELRSRISAVLITKTTNIGTLILGKLDSNCYQKHHTDFIRQVVEQIAISIENYRLLKISRFYVDQLQRARDEFDNFNVILFQNLTKQIAEIEQRSAKLLDYLKQGISDANLDYLHGIFDKINKMSQYIDQSSELSRIGGISQPLKLVNISEIIQQSKMKLLNIINQKKITIIINNMLPTIYCDQQLFQQVFDNLITNAIQCIDDNSHNNKIEIGYSDENDADIFFIRSNSSGIGKEFQEDIFNLLHFKDYDKGDNKGIGLGLAIAKKIVEMHKGQIWYESEQGKGSTYFFSLPGRRVKSLST